MGADSGGAAGGCLHTSQGELASGQSAALRWAFSAQIRSPGENPQMGCQRSDGRCCSESAALAGIRQMLQLRNCPQFPHAAQMGQPAQNPECLLSPEVNSL